MSASKPLSVTVLDNGPLKITGDRLTVRYCGEPVELEEGAPVVLCRCGESENAPFCDGSHARTNFVAEPPAGPRRELRVWEGQTIRTFFNPSACMHVFYCKPLKELRAREQAGDASAAAEIARAVRSCPSGALSYETKGEAALAGVEPDAAADIEIVEGGELRIQRGFEINCELQARQAADRATLCRCGLSKNKPWCDGRHRKRENFR